MAEKRGLLIIELSSDPDPLSSFLRPWKPYQQKEIPTKKLTLARMVKLSI